MQDQMLKERDESPGVEPRVFQSDLRLKELAEKASAFKLPVKPKRNRFKSAKALKLTPKQRWALIETLKLLEKGKIKHITENKVERHYLEDYEKTPKPIALFNMGEDRKSVV